MGSLTDMSVIWTSQRVQRFVLRSTKLYTVLLYLSVYTYFTFAQEIIANPQDWAYRVDNAPPNEKRSSAPEHNPDDPNDELYIRPLHLNTGTEGEGFVDDSNYTYDLPQNPRFGLSGPKLYTLTSHTHVNRVAWGIAQDLFFHPSDFNWNEAEMGTYLHGCK